MLSFFGKNMYKFRKKKFYFQFRKMKLNCKKLIQFVSLIKLNYCVGTNQFSTEIHFSIISFSINTVQSEMANKNAIHPQQRPAIAFLLRLFQKLNSNRNEKLF